MAGSRPGLCRSVGEIIGVDTAYLENTVSGRLQEGLDSLEENILPGMLSQSMQYVQWFMAGEDFW